MRATAPRRVFRLLIATLGALALPALATAQTPQTPPAQPAAAAPAEPTADDLLHQADQLLRAGKYDEAAAAIQRAESIAGGPCGDCLLGLGMVRTAQKRWDEALDLTRRAIPLLKSPESLARAYNQLGLALARGQGDADRLKQAEAALRQAADIGGAWGSVARYNLAQVLFLEKRYADAAKVAREQLESVGAEDSTAQPARVVLCQARAALPEEPAPEGAESPRKEGQVTRPAKIAGPPPVYTEEARKAKVEGTVILECVVDREGCVRQPKVLQGLSNGLSEAALAALRQWVFQPATLEGKPVSVYYTLSVTFKVDNEPPKKP